MPGNTIGGKISNSQEAGDGSVSSSVPEMTTDPLVQISATGKELPHSGKQINHKVATTKWAGDLVTTLQELKRSAEMLHHLTNDVKELLVHSKESGKTQHLVTQCPPANGEVNPGIVRSNLVVQPDGSLVRDE
jgi:hypothetical protein